MVAGWEFRRYFKWKDQLISLLFFLVLGAGWLGVAALIARNRGPVTIALDGVALPAPDSGRIRFVTALPPAERRTALREGAINGVLSRGADGHWSLEVAKDPRYRAELVRLLAAYERRERLGALGLTDSALTRLLEAPVLAVAFLDSGRAGRTQAEQVAALVFMVIMIIAVFTSLAYVLTGITGEKQLRVTESIIALIPPQAWIDGKILGIAAFALWSAFAIVVGGLIVGAAAMLTTGFTIPAAAIRPHVLVALALFMALGLLLWNAFFAAVAATVDDPNTSSRSALMFVPMLPVVLSLGVLQDPDGTLARVIALVPLTSAPAMPMRLVVSDPGVVEIAGSVLLLAGAIWLLRRAAGRIFEIGMLMYGQEPSLAEVVRWTRS